MKRAISLFCAGALCVGLLAGCSGTPSPTPDTTATETVSFRLNWWGEQSRHDAYLAAVDGFNALNPGLTAVGYYGADVRWEEWQITALQTGYPQEALQVEGSWISLYSADGSLLTDLNQYADRIDLSQFPREALDACTANGELQALPLSYSARAWLWNAAVFEAAGITVPTTLDELLAAGRIFRDVLGEEWYPLMLDADDRMDLVICYLQSVHGIPWAADGTVSYTAEQTAEGLELIRLLEENHAIPAWSVMEQNTARYAGAWDWDLNAPAHRAALAEGGELTVGNVRLGEYSGGIYKVALALALAENCPCPAEAALLLEYLVNGEGAAALGTQCGVPVSAAGLCALEQAGTADPLVLQAHESAMNAASFLACPQGDSLILSGEDGTYEQVFSGWSCGDYPSAQQAAQWLLQDVERVLAEASGAQ